MALLLAAALAGWWWSRKPALPAALPAPVAPPRALAPAPAAAKRTLPPKRARPSVRAQLLKLLEEKTPELEACASAGPPPRLGVRLTLRPDGRVKSVELSSEPPTSPSLLECVRGRMQRWELLGVSLAKETPLLFSLSLRAK